MKEWAEKEKQNESLYVKGRATDKETGQTGADYRRVYKEVGRVTTGKVLRNIKVTRMKAEKMCYN